MPDLKLLPCPFCNTNQDNEDLEIVYSKESNTGANVVKCWGCGAIGPYGASNKNLAIQMWNKRSPKNGTT